jgi:hypothetical protein
MSWSFRRFLAFATQFISFRGELLGELPELFLGAKVEAVPRCRETAIVAILVLLPGWLLIKLAVTAANHRKRGRASLPESNS